jgi:hypothetical protein
VPLLSDIGSHYPVQIIPCKFPFVQHTKHGQIVSQCFRAVFTYSLECLATSDGQDEGVIYKIKMKITSCLKLKECHTKTPINLSNDLKKIKNSEDIESFTSLSISQVFYH